MSCCMRDAVTLEARGIATAIVVNDVFEPIAHATAALLALPADYVAKNIVWLPHPTSNLTAVAAAALIDERIDAIRGALLGRYVHDTNSHGDRDGASGPLDIARSVIAGLVASLQADGADLVLLRYDDGRLEGELRIGDVTCDDGSCIMPADALAKMVEALVRPRVPGLRGVTVREIAGGAANS